MCRKWKKFKAFRIIRSFAKFICIKLRPCLDSYKSFEIIEQAGAMEHTFEIV